LRDQLMMELSDLTTADEAAGWAHRVLRVKDTLTAVDAERVEQAFQTKLATLMRKPKDEPSRSDDEQRQT
jgi:hypothetical protein